MNVKKKDGLRYFYKKDIFRGCLIFIWKYKFRKKVFQLNTNRIFAWNNIFRFVHWPFFLPVQMNIKDVLVLNDLILKKGLVNVKKLSSWKMDILHITHLLDIIRGNLWLYTVKTTTLLKPITHKMREMDKKTILTSKT